MRQERTAEPRPPERVRTRVDADWLWRRPLGLVVVAVVLIQATTARPAPGLHGTRLGVLLALVAFAVGLLGGREAIIRDTPLPLRLALYRTAQESLTNIRRHASPERVDLQLDYGPSGTRLVVEDCAGDGERPPPRAAGGYGLTGMRERAELLGGTLTAAPTGHGFRVELWVPA